MPKNANSFNNSTNTKQNLIRFKSLISDLKRRLSSDLLQYTNQNEDHSQNILIVSIAEQKLYSINNSAIHNSYSISTAEAGIGNQSGSFQTPLGIHCISDKIGSGVSSGSIFKGRKNIHQIATIILDPKIRSENDNITSRILRLEGLESGINKGVDNDNINVDSYSRYIYIHGTDEEGRLGKPASHGCVRMANQDIIELFEKIETGTLVIITKD